MLRSIRQSQGPVEAWFATPPGWMQNLYQLEVLQAAAKRSNALCTSKRSSALYTSSALVLSFCDGIGAVLQASLEKWGDKARLHAWEIIPEATRVCKARAPRCMHYGDLGKLTNSIL